MLQIAILCGGPSRERGISLNSARSFLDHTSDLEIELTVLYVNLQGHYYRLTHGQLYSNTPSDFDFKLAGAPLSEPVLIELLQSVDLVFPLIHGPYGEDGTLQSFLEMRGIPHVGSGSVVCQTLFNKAKAHAFFAAHGFAALPYQVIRSLEDPLPSFPRAVIKPTLSGSSLGVHYVDSPEAASKAIAHLWDEGFRELLIEPYCQDAEFTVCVLETPRSTAQALIPVEIDIGAALILDYRKKYLPADETRYYCPPRFSSEAIREIQREAERLFVTAGLRDFVRVDGWLSPEGIVRFSDLNPISGMEQNSFLFQQAARIGISHGELIDYILRNALRRHGIQKTLQRRPRPSASRPIHILMGGKTSERQVALMSGTNVWLKLLQEESCTPFLLDPDHNVWQLPYAFALHHTVEEIRDHCQQAEEKTLQVTPLANAIRKNLGLAPFTQELPVKMDLPTFLAQAKQSSAFVFLGLHGGIGEDGTLQEALETLQIPFNGSGSKASRLCMDKHQTALRIAALQDPFILAMPQISFRIHEAEEAWSIAAKQFQTTDLLIKPQCDGCSTGVARLQSFKEFLHYIDCVRKEIRYGTIEMPDSLLCHQKVSGWLEMTLGVLESQDNYTALNPSITVAESHVLSLEEKFQGGTGMNITPPPEELLSLSARTQVQQSACRIAQALGIQGYARLDLFVECATGRVRVIEANSLPALTPSTVLYHQALSLSPPLSPRQLLKLLLSNLGNNSKKS